MYEINEIRRLAGLPHTYEEEFLYEAAPSKKRLLSMFNAPLQALSAIEELVDDDTPYISDYISTIRGSIDYNLDWSREKLIREDRVIYYLRFGLIDVLGQLIDLVDKLKQEVNRIDTSKESAVSNLVEKLRPALIKKIAKILKHGSFLDSNPTKENIDTIRGKYLYDFERHVEHYLSLPIPNIQGIIWDKQKKRELIKEFEEEEKEWQEQNKRRIPAPFGIQVIEQFDDGFAWFNLETAYCSAEAEAMGHCGNSPRSYTDDIILSLRKVVVSGSDNFHIPHLTFILDDEGKLTEMKGRANEKPAKKYHPYIIKLLLNNAIKGIQGGGYLPENNFSLYDLDESVRKDLLNRKPALADPITRIIIKYENEGVTEDLLGEINDGFIDSQNRSISRAFKDIDDDYRVIISDNFYFDDWVNRLVGDFEDYGAGIFAYAFGDKATPDLLTLLYEVEDPDFGLPLSLGTYGQITKAGTVIFKKLLSVLPTDFLDMVGVDIDNIFDQFNKTTTERNDTIKRSMRNFENDFEILSEAMEEAYKKQEVLWEHTDTVDDIISNLRDRLNTYFKIGYETDKGLQFKTTFPLGKDTTSNRWHITISPEQAIGILELDAGIQEERKFADLSLEVYKALGTEHGYMILDLFTMRKDVKYNYERIDRMRTEEGLSPSTEKDEYAEKLRSEDKRFDIYRFSSNKEIDNVMDQFDWDKMKQDVITTWNEVHNTSPEKQYATESFESDIDEIKRLAGL